MKENINELRRKINMYNGLFLRLHVLLRFRQVFLLVRKKWVSRAENQMG